MRIVIPSLSRWDTVHTLDAIPSPYREQTTLVVPPHQQRRYAKHNPGTQIVPCSAKGIAPTRQWCIEHFTDDKLFFADDDGRFFIRRRMASPKLTSILDDTEAQRRMWDTLANGLDHVAQVGISYRSGNNTVSTRYKSIAKAFSFWGVRRPLLEELGIRIDATPVMEDFHVTLALLTRGYANRVYYKWAWDQRSSNAPWGCSDWRTPEVQARGANLLHTLYPDFTKIVIKQPKTGWFDGQPRTDINVQWKKAYQSAEPKSLPSPVPLCASS